VVEAKRKGKWSVEEERYAQQIIADYKQGLLALCGGATLRTYLASKLNCEPMRITKKFAGAACIRKRSMRAGLVKEQQNWADMVRARCTRLELEAAFHDACGAQSKAEQARYRYLNELERVEELSAYGMHETTEMRTATSPTPSSESSGSDDEERFAKRVRVY